MSIFAIKSVPSKNNEKTKKGRKQNGKNQFYGNSLNSDNKITYNKYKI